jgi:hypothetical protein
MASRNHAGPIDPIICAMNFIACPVDNANVVTRVETGLFGTRLIVDLKLPDGCVSDFKGVRVEVRDAVTA